MTKLVAVVMAAVMVMLAAMPASAQFGDEASELRMYMNARTQQGIIVTILEDLEMDPALMMSMIDEQFVEENMSGFMVLASETMTPEALRGVGADAGKMFGIVDDEFNEAIVIVLADDGDLILLAFIGFESDRDFDVAALFSRDVVREGIDARPPSGFTPYSG